MVRTPNPDKQRVDYPNNKKVFRRGDVIYKYDPTKLTSSWKNKMESIRKMWTLDGFLDFVDNGYTSKYINGTDLHGNKPFSSGASSYHCILPDADKLKVLNIFSNAQRVGEQLGYTFGDITCGNMMWDGKNIILIDFDVITEYPLNSDYIRIWNNTLNIIFYKYIRRRK